MGSLTEVQESIIVGKLLGDGSLRRKKNTLLEINHSSRQKEYVYWLYEQLKTIVLTPPKLRKSGNNRFSYRFTTASIKELNSSFEDFYLRKSYKSVPITLKLNGLSLAIWFMDDGSKSRDTVYLNTQQFDIDSQQILKKALNELQLATSLNRDKIYYRIRLRNSCMRKFAELVKPYVIKSMLYKLP